MNKDDVRRMLESIQWTGTRTGPGSGPMGSGGDGYRSRACPWCQGIDPRDPFVGSFIDEARGHRPGCLIGEAIKKGVKNV